MESPKYLLAVRPLPDDSDVEGVRRLRSLLKIMLRTFRIRCVSCEPWTEPKPPKPAEDATPAQEPRKRRRLKAEKALPASDALPVDQQSQLDPATPRGHQTQSGN